MNIAIIPARKGSKGFPGKNILFFSMTEKFINKSGLFDRVIINTDDESLIEIAKDAQFETYSRPQYLAGNDISINSVFQDMVTHLKCNGEDYLWLFYIPLLYKNIDDFVKGKKIIDKLKPDSLSTFIPARTHPYNCWKYDKNLGVIQKYIDNQLFNRQDYEDAWENYHYVFAIKVNALEKSDNNLLSNKTEPMFLDNDTANKLVEIDTPEDLKKWKNIDQTGYMDWLNSLNDKCKKILLETIDLEMM